MYSSVIWMKMRLKKVSIQGQSDFHQREIGEDSRVYL